MILYFCALSAGNDEIVHVHEHYHDERRIKNHLVLPSPNNVVAAHWTQHNLWILVTQHPCEFHFRCYNTHDIISKYFFLLYLSFSSIVYRYSFFWFKNNLKITWLYNDFSYKKLTATLDSLSSSRRAKASLMNISG